MNAYLIVTTVLFSLLSVVWTSKNWFNTFIKVTFTGMTGWSIFLLLTQLGYVVKIG